MYNEDKLKEIYRMTYDLHTHTRFSHGKGLIEDNVKAALDKGLSAIGISDHGPGHLTYGVKSNEFPVMKKEIQRLSKIYHDIQILLGVEANMINASGKLDLKETDLVYLDFILAGYHYGIFGEQPLRAARTHIVNFYTTYMKKRDRLINIRDDRNRQKKINTEIVIKALYENDIKVLTHPGDKGRFDLMEIAKACEYTDTLMEISTWHEAPLTEELKLLAETGVKFIISSDAHSPERVGTYIPGLIRAMKAGIDPERIVNIKEY